MKITTQSKALTALLLAAMGFVLVLNFVYLYSTPVVNSWVWWRGDETWLMAQYHHFILTGYAIDPLAPGSVFAQCSGLLSGSAYLTAALYGLPLAILHGHTIAIGRTITWLISLATVAAVWWLAKKYEVPPVLRASGALLLSSSLCFFITSHSARPDMLIGLAVLIIAGYLPIAMQRGWTKWTIIVALMLPLALLVNGHVFLNTFLVFGYLVIIGGALKSYRSFAATAAVASAGFAVLLAVQYGLFGSLSLLGPFNGATNMVPVTRILHPRSDLANLTWRLFIAKTWAPGVLGIAALLGIAIAWGGAKNGMKSQKVIGAQQRFLICAALVVVSSVLIEFYQDRYFIYVLPTIVLAFMVVAATLFKRLPKLPSRILGWGLAACLIFSVWRYYEDATRLARTGEAITVANASALHDALALIHSRHTGAPRIFSAVAGQAALMDDSCELVTPVMYAEYGAEPRPRSEIWRDAKIDYAITFTTLGGGDWNENDSTIEYEARSHARKIFERVGPYTDIVRGYTDADSRLVDTMRVYEFTQN